MIVDLDAAKTSLSWLIDPACAGEEVIITVDARAAVRLVPITRANGRRVFGSMKGRLALTRDFSEPLPDDELSAWNQERLIRTSPARA
jgi:antitoxin (DNA-binding transcriptional repressor) of toxin-antitoxin stability system